MRIPIALSFLAVSALAIDSAHAGWFEIAIKSDAARAESGANFGGDPQGQFGLGVRGVYNDERDTEVGVLIARFEAASDGVPGLSFAFGIDAMAGTGDDRDVGAAALSIDAELAPPEWRGAFFGAGVEFAPGIFAWSDTESLVGWNVRAGYRINAKARIFAMYEELRVDFVEVGRKTLDDGVKAGFGVRF